MKQLSLWLFLSGGLLNQAAFGADDSNNLMVNGGAEKLIDVAEYWKSAISRTQKTTPQVPEGFGHRMASGITAWGSSDQTAHSGRRSAFMELKSDGAKANISLLFASSDGYNGKNATVVEENTDYLVSFWAKGDMKSLSAGVIQWTRDSEFTPNDRTTYAQIPIQIILSDSWQKFEFKFHIEEGVGRIAVGLNARGAELARGQVVYVDDVSITKVKRPAPIPKAKVTYQEIAPRFKAAASRMLERRMREAADLQAFQYDIPWGSSYDLNFYLDGYEATRDKDYLDMFVKLADKVLAARADKLGEKDWKGRLRPGWMTEKYFSVGGPVTLFDAKGKPSLEIRTTLADRNDSTRITVIPDEKNQTFSIIANNSKYDNIIYNRKFDNVTMANVEQQLKIPNRAIFRVKRVGNEIPAAIGPFTPPLNMFVMHSHHTGKIVAPFARLAAIVKQNPELSSKYGSAAAKFLQAAEESMLDMKDDWVDYEDGGYVIFERGMPFWSDGIAEPNNTLSLTGSAYLYLFEATGNLFYRERAEKMARFMKKELQIKKNGTVNFTYWSRVNSGGWKEADGCTNTPDMKMSNRPEDSNHLQLSLRFFAECCRRQIVFTQADLLPLAKTFHERLDLSASGGMIADQFNGRGTAGHGKNFQMGWAEWYDIDPSVTERIREIFENLAPKGEIPASTTPLATWGVLLRAEAYQKLNQMKNNEVKRVD